jgi:hypothetical protein
MLISHPAGTAEWSLLESTAPDPALSRRIEDPDSHKIVERPDWQMFAADSLKSTRPENASCLFAVSPSARIPHRIPALGIISVRKVADGLTFFGAGFLAPAGGSNQFRQIIARLKRQ